MESAYQRSRKKSQKKTCRGSYITTVNGYGLYLFGGQVSNHEDRGDAYISGTAIVGIIDPSSIFDEKLFQTQIMDAVDKGKYCDIPFKTLKNQIRKHVSDSDAGAEIMRAFKAYCFGAMFESIAPESLLDVSEKDMEAVRKEAVAREEGTFFYYRPGLSVTYRISKDPEGQKDFIIEILKTEKATKKKYS
jgi:hypothetical protein